MSREIRDLSLYDRLRVHSSVFLSVNQGVAVDDEGARILKQIEKSSPIREAVKKIGKDYRTVWLKISSMEKACGTRLVERSLGGAGGGYAKLILAGSLLLQKYKTAGKKLGAFKDSKTVLKPDLLIIGSHCPCLELLVEKLEDKNLCVEYVYAGSLVGLEMVYRGIGYCRCTRVKY